MPALRQTKLPQYYVFRRYSLDYMVDTNLFRDQLDRYGEIDITMNILEDMIRKVPKMKVIVNGDDALSAYLAMDCGNPYVLPTESANRCLKMIPMRYVRTDSVKDAGNASVQFLPLQSAW